MPDPTTLIVPIRVSALCVGVPDASETHGQAPMADFSRLPYASGGAVHHRGPYASTRALAESTPFEGAVQLPAGVHVHWTLPAGLSHAVQSEEGAAMAFPAVPNRWLVARIVASASGAVQAATFLVESDRLSATPTAHPGLAQPTVPVAAAPGQGFRYLGATFPYDGWTEDPSAERLAPFTAVGYGEPTFAAYYPNCAGVFGFYDPVDILPHGYDPRTQTLSYYVAGWYGTAADDPLSAGGVAPEENAYGWTWEGGGAPRQTLCTGVVGGLAYDPNTAYLAPAASPLVAALAPSPQEALSALMADALAKANPGQDFSNAEALLNALQFGLLSRPLSADAVEEFEETVHAAGFDAAAAGTLWTVTAADGDGSSAEGGEATLPAPLGAQLDALNTAQLRLDDLRREAAARRRQVFADWHRYQVAAYEPQRVPDALRTRLTDVRLHIEAEMDALDALTGPGGALDAQQAQVDAAAAALAAALDPSLRLAGDAVAPRFRRAIDPVLVLSGPDVVPRGVPDPAGEDDGRLRCRTDDQLVSGVSLAAGFVPGSAAISTRGLVLAPVSTAPPGFAAPVFTGAATDAYYWTPALQPAVAAGARAMGGGSSNPAALDFAGTVAGLQASCRLFLRGEPTGGATYTGAAPAPRAATEWAGTPWLPLLLQYDVAYSPVHPSLGDAGPSPYPDDLILAGFTFDDDSIDLVYRGDAPRDRVSYAGSTVLSAGAATELAGALRRWIAGTASDDPRVAEALAAVETMPLLAQGMGGMGEEMLMRRQTLQMAVADPLAPSPLRDFVARVADAAGGETSLSPLPQVSFNPVRAGSLAVARLRLVDAFGRFRDYTAPEVVVARGLAPPPSLALPAGTAFLPPRITQGARLLFRWVSAAGQAESTGAPSTSPVFGWVIPNYLDRALALYAADGTPLGSLGLSADGASVLWAAAPGGAWPLGTPLAGVMAGQDAGLAAFATSLAEGGAAYFAPFFDAVRDALAFSLPARFREDVGTAVLLGQPLALARASLTLSLAGPPATDQSWAAFTAAVLGDGDVDVAWDGGLAGVRFPVRLGAPSQLGDTLVGYWTAPGGTTDYGTFYAPSAAGWNGPVGPPADGTVTLTPRAESDADAAVTLLLDPRGQVHASTGVLPVDAVSIPPPQYADALRSLALAFAAGPVLSGTNAPAEDGAAPPMTLVRPKVSSGAWTWVTVADGAWAATDLVDAPSDAGTLSYSPQHVSDGWMVLTAPGTSSSST